MTDHTTNKSFLKSGIFKVLPLISMIGIIVGAIGGYIYYDQVVCTTGGCPLTSNPYITVIWGAVIGYLLFDMFKKKKPAGTDQASE
jgi:hypothetical protein